MKYFQHTAFLLGFLLRATAQQWEVVKGDVVRSGELVKIRVIRDDGGDVHRQIAGFVAKQQVIEAVADFRDHDHQARFGGFVNQLPIHVKSFGNRCEFGFERYQINVAAALLKIHAHEESIRIGVVELRRVDDVAAALE